MSNPAVKAIPEGMHSLTPYLTCANAPEAIAFYTRAFGAVEVNRLLTPQGRIMHAMLKIGNSPLMMTEESTEYGMLGPKLLKGSPVMICLYVENVDAMVAQAVAAGAKVTVPVTDMFWGDRFAALEDPYGHRWSIATHTRDLTPEQIQAAALEAHCSGPK